MQLWVGTSDIGPAICVCAHVRVCVRVYVYIASRSVRTCAHIRGGRKVASILDAPSYSDSVCPPLSSPSRFILPLSFSLFYVRACMCVPLARRSRRPGSDREMIVTRPADHIIHDTLSTLAARPMGNESVRSADAMMLHRAGERRRAGSVLAGPGRPRRYRGTDTGVTLRYNRSITASGGGSLRTTARDSDLDERGSSLSFSSPPISPFSLCMSLPFDHGKWLFREDNLRLFYLKKRAVFSRALVPQKYFRFCRRYVFFSAAENISRDISYDCPARF